MAVLKQSKRGRPRQVELREIGNAIFYVLRTGCAWRLLPHDLPAWQSVYGYFSMPALFLTGVIVYGAPAFGLALLLGAIGIPLPGSLLVIAAGAFVRQGALDGGAALSLGLLGAVLGDSLSYGLGRFAKRGVEARFGQAAVWHKAQTTFNRRGGLTLYLTRFLFTPLAIPVPMTTSGIRCDNCLIF